MNRSTLQKALAEAGVDATIAGQIVQTQLAAGEVTDDMAVDPATVDAHMDAVAKAMGGQPAAADAGDADALAKAEAEAAAAAAAAGGDDDALVKARAVAADAADALAKAEAAAAAADDGYNFGGEPAVDPAADGTLPFADVLDTVAKGAQEIVENVEAKHEVLCKAYLDMGSTLKAMTRGLEVQAQRLERIEKAMGGKLSELAKALDTTVAPRAADLHVVPHPGDGNGADAGDTREDVLNKVMSKLLKATDMNEKHRLKSAVSQLEMIGANHTAIAKSFGL